MSYNFPPDAQNNGKGVAVANPAGATPSAPAAITTTQTAGGTYTATEQAMLAALKADVTALRATVASLVTDNGNLRTTIVALRDSLKNANLTS